MGRSSSIMWPFSEGGRGGRFFLSCVFYCSIAETRHPSMARFSKEFRRVESVAMPVSR